MKSIVIHLFVAFTILSAADAQSRFSRSNEKPQGASGRRVPTDTIVLRVSKDSNVQGRGNTREKAPSSGFFLLESKLPENRKTTTVARIKKELRTKLKTPIVTRWNSLYDSMKDLLKNLEGQEKRKNRKTEK